MSIWDDIAAGADAAWDGVTDAATAAKDFLTPDPETGTFTSAPPSGNKFYTPIHWDGLENTHGDIGRKIEDLRDPLFDMYQREYGLAQWPDYAFVINRTQGEYDRDEMNDHSVTGGTNDMVHPHKPSDILPYRVPQDATDEQQYAIRDAASTDTASAIDQVNTAYFEILDDGSLAEMDGLLQDFSSGLMTVDDLIVTHENSGFARLTELFEGWVGDDSDTAAEKFGLRLRPGIGLQREIGCNLLAAAIEECSVKLTAQLQLGEALDQVHENIEAITTGHDSSFKITAKIAFNQIPFGSDILTILDGIFEVANDYTKDDAASGWVNNRMKDLEMEYEMAVTPQKGSSLLSELLAAAESAKTAVETAREAAAVDLDIRIGTWTGLYKTDPQVLIPGEPG